MIYCVNEINHIFCVPFLSDLLAFLICSIFIKTLSRNEGSAKLSHFFFRVHNLMKKILFPFLYSVSGYILEVYHLLTETAIRGVL